MKWLDSLTMIIAVLLIAAAMVSLAMLTTTWAFLHIFTSVLEAMSL